MDNQKLKKGRRMTTNDYVIKRKLNILEFADTLKNISKACKNLGVSRQHYYDIKRAISEEGIEGLLEKSRKKPNLHNRVAPEVERSVIDYAIQYPAHGQVRASNELKKKNIFVSSGGVRGIWLRNKLETKALRLKKLEEISAKENKILTESQLKALEDKKIEEEAHGEIETHHSGFLLGQDTFYVGYIKGVGKIYQQTGIDTFSNFGFAKLYPDKNQTVAADFLNDKVLPQFDKAGIPLLRTLTDRGTEYCGLPESHHYQLFLMLNDIEHSRTKVRSPQTNGCTERLNQIIFDEFYKTQFRRKIYTSIEEMQKDLDIYMQEYNFERTNQGKRCKGRTPAETFVEGVQLAKKYLYQHALPAPKIIH